LLGSYLGAALIFILPILLRLVPPQLGIPIHPATAEHVSFIVVGILIIFFLIAEPHGLARLWQIGKQKLRVWPYPY
jgi:branched-chain amino acid transport system permease protein